jgi:hypothetical protein
VYFCIKNVEVLELPYGEVVIVPIVKIVMVIKQFHKNKMREPVSIIAQSKKDVKR